MKSAALTARAIKSANRKTNAGTREAMPASYTRSREFVLSAARLEYRATRMKGQDAARLGVLSVNARGFGFVSSAGFDDDLYVAEGRLGGGMHGDLVEARLVSRSYRGSEGEVIRV